jgi:hypothetical protein
MLTKRARRPLLGLKPGMGPHSPRCCMHNIHVHVHVPDAPRRTGQISFAHPSAGTAEMFTAKARCALTCSSGAVRRMKSGAVRRARPDTDRANGAVRAPRGHVFALRQPVPRDHILTRLQGTCRERFRAKARLVVSPTHGSEARESLQMYAKRPARAWFEPAELSPRAPAASVNGVDDELAQLIIVVRYRDFLPRS